MVDVAEVARQYEDIEIEVFFESSDDDDVPTSPRRTGSHSPAASYPATLEQIAADLQRLASALEQQPYRTQHERGLRNVCLRQRANAQWTLLTAPRDEAEIHPLIQRDTVRCA